jgi:hypothetical protein
MIIKKNKLGRCHKVGYTVLIVKEQRKQKCRP